VGVLQKRPKEQEGKGGEHEVHHKTVELLRKTLNNPLMHSIPFYSLAGASSVLLSEEVFAKQGRGTDRKGEFIHRFSSPTIFTSMFSFSMFSVLGLSNPKQQGRAIQALQLHRAQTSAVSSLPPGRY